MTDFIVQILGKKARLCCLLVDIVICVGSLLMAVVMLWIYTNQISSYLFYCYYYWVQLSTHQSAR
jgi:tryptophan-rich sensory protein